MKLIFFCEKEKSASFRFYEVRMEMMSKVPFSSRKKLSHGTTKKHKKHKIYSWRENVWPHCSIYRFRNKSHDINPISVFLIWMKNSAVFFLNLTTRYTTLQHCSLWFRVQLKEKVSVKKRIQKDTTFERK